ncbi:hypothetical protein C8J57DRAFT_1623789 [Mycena rebaudengoi]|nr:hypothetical protein C8J57DRAFT_1623789 [Mycena rebaudengoi]
MRILIVKLSLDPSPCLPLGIICDIGFENRLTLDNTRLLMCYLMVNRAHVRTMVLFLKVCSKHQKINCFIKEQFPPMAAFSSSSTSWFTLRTRQSSDAPYVSDWVNGLCAYPSSLR